MRRIFLTVLACLAMTGMARADAPAAGPSFDCSRVHAAVNKLICATPELAVLDKKLSDDFNNTKFQGGIDGKALQADEDAWLRDVRNKCADIACLKTVYQTRDAKLLDQSLHAASPAAYDDTRPFPVDPALWTEVRADIGKSCGAKPGDTHVARPGYSTPKGFLDIVGSNGFYVQALQKNGTRFAFLVEFASGPNACLIRDVVTLPASDKGNVYLQCNVDGIGNGPGMRLAGKSDVVGFWTVNAERRVLERQPIDVLGQGTIRCTQPEGGE